VTVTDFASGVVDVNVDLAPNYVWQRFRPHCFCVHSGHRRDYANIVQRDATVLDADPGFSPHVFNFDGMGVQQYGLDFTGPNDSVSADLNFRLEATGLSTASFVPGGASNDTGLKYYFLADICTDSDGRCSGQATQTSGLVGALAPVPIPAALPLLLSGLIGFAAIARRRKSA